VNANTGHWLLETSEGKYYGSGGLPDLLALVAGWEKPEEFSLSQLAKLLLLRVVVIVAAAFMSCRKGVKQGAWRWLLHYCLGSGADKAMPLGYIEKDLPSILNKVDARGTVHWNSNDWSGTGFNDRPEGFYTVGGFTGKVEDDTFTFEDEYDWHPMYRESPNGCGKAYLWCVSEFNLPTLDLTQWVGKLPRLAQPYALRALDRLGITNLDPNCLAEDWLGSEYFTAEDRFFGTTGISNRLWNDLKYVGARSFKTVFTHKI
jgi:hypothetical protein